MNGTGQAMKQRRAWSKKRIVLSALFVALLGGLLWVLLPAPDPLFHGKPESEWIKHLSYNDEQQIKQWREFGPDGVRVLVRALDKANRPLDRMYRKVYRAMGSVLPRGFMDRLPTPRMDATLATRQLVCAMLSNLGKEARIAVPAMVRALNDENPHVRLFAITFFGYPETQEAVLSQMTEKERQRLLPEFIRAMRDSDLSMRYNAAVALRYYPERREVVAPVLVKALQDTNSQIRLLAARALNRVDPDAAKKTGAVLAVIKILKDPNDPYASRAANVLRDFRREPELAVPALIECLQGTNTGIACEAVWSFEWSPKEFRNFDGIIIPALRQTAQRKDHVGRYAEVALKRLVSETPAIQGTPK